MPGDLSAMSVAQLWEHAAAWWPDAPAVRDPSMRLTYRELNDAASRYAIWLAGRGVRPGDRVIVRTPNSVSMTALLAGILRAGAIAVPTSRAMSHFQFASVVGDAEPRLIVAGADESRVLSEIGGDAVISLDDSWEQALLTSPVESLSFLPQPCSPDDVCLLMYTSGSTSAPKGVMCTHRQVRFALQAVAARLDYRPEDAVFCRVPLSFDYGLYQVLLCAASGSELVLPPMDADPGLLRWLRRWHATVVPVVPSLAAMLSDLARRDPRPTAVRLFTNTGAVLDATTAAGLRATFPGAKIAPMFGTTECKRVSIMEPDGDLLRPGSVGRPLDGTVVTVVDPAGRPMPAGEIGEFVVHGPHVMAGYWRAGELTAQRFRVDPVDGGRVLFTGDFGWMDDAGYLYFVGRRDDIFKSKGVRVSTTEIEAAALDIPGVRAAAALPPTAEAGSVLYAVGDLTSAEVFTGLRARLESAKIPDRCVIVGALPTTANGKIDRSALKTSGPSAEFVSSGGMGEGA